MTEKELTEIKQGKPTKITLDMMVLSEFDNIPFDELNENSKIEAERELDDVR